MCIFLVLDLEAQMEQNSNYSTTTTTILPLQTTKEEPDPLQMAKDFEQHFNCKVFPIIFGIGCFWNLLIIAYFVKINRGKGLRNMSSYHFLIIILAFVDLLVTMGITVRFCFHPIEILGEEAGLVACILVHTFSAEVGPMISCWVLILISYGRYRSIVYPLKARMTKRKSCLLSIIIFMVICSINIYTLMKTKIIHEPGDRSKCDFGVSGVYMAVQLIVNFIIDSLIPLIVMAYFYFKMKKNMKKEVTTNKTRHNERASTFSLSDQSQRRNRRALKTIKGLLILFIITVFCMRILFMINLLAIQPIATGHENITVVTYSTIAFPVILTLFYSNNILNIFVYAKMIPDFRKFVLTVLTLGMCGRKKMTSKQTLSAYTVSKNSVM
eukprot:TCONS_00073582-protein